MKKVLAILVVAMFLGGITAPVFASNNSGLLTITQVEKDPKKAKETKTDEAATKTEKKSGDCEAKTEKKSSDCATETKKDCGGK